MRVISVVSNTACIIPLQYIYICSKKILKIAEWVTYIRTWTRCLYESLIRPLNGKGLENGDFAQNAVISHKLYKTDTKLN